MSSRIDLRKHPRISPIVIPVEYETGGVAREGYLLNVSRGGAFLAAERVPAVDEAVRLRIPLPWDLGEIQAEAKVVWRTDQIEADNEVPTGAGLAFTRISADATEKLQRYMERFTRLAAQID